MFFIGVFGIQDKIKLQNEFSNIICKCGELSNAEFYEKYRYFHVFFIPVYKWNKAYLVRTTCCNNIFNVSEDYANELKCGTDIDMNRLEEIETLCKENLRGICAVCKECIYPSFSYCPYCGNRVY